MDHSSFLDYVDKRKYWDLTKELNKKAKNTTELGLKKLLAKYREWQLSRKYDVELQVNMDDETSLQQFQRLKFEVEDLKFRNEQLDLVLQKTLDREEKKDQELRDLSYRLTQAVNSKKSITNELQLT